MLKRNVMRVVAVVVVLCAIGFAGASAASAVVFTLTTQACTGGANVALCYELESKAACTGTTQLCELKGKQSESVSGGDVMFRVPLAGLLILCSTATGSGTITQEEPLVAGKHTTLEGTITYEGCTLEEGPTECTITSPATTKVLSGSLETEIELKLKPATGSVIIEIEFLGPACPLKGRLSVTGTQSVTIEHPGVDEKTKTGTAVVKSGLVVIGDPAELEQTLVMSFTGLEDLVDVVKIA